MLITGRQVRVLDWGLPGAGAPWVDPAFLVLRLILAGHPVTDAEAWARQIPAWAQAGPECVTAFAAYVAGLWSYWALTDPQPATERRARTARDYAAWRVLGSTTLVHT